MKLILLLGFVSLLQAALVVGESQDLEKGSNVTVSYYIWGDHDPLTAIRSREYVTVSFNVTFFEVMEVAATERVDYEFKYKQYSFGKAITSIGNNAENRYEGKYWTLYKLETEPNVFAPPSDHLKTPAGVDGTFVSDHDIYLFWLKIYKEYKNDA